MSSSITYINVNDFRWNALTVQHRIYTLELQIGEHFIASIYEVRSPGGGEGGGGWAGNSY